MPGEKLCTNDNLSQTAQGSHVERATIIDRTSVSSRLREQRHDNGESLPSSESIPSFFSKNYSPHSSPCGSTWSPSTLGAPSSSRSSRSIATLAGRDGMQPDGTKQAQDDIQSMMIVKIEHLSSKMLHWQCTREGLPGKVSHFCGECGVRSMMQNRSRCCGFMHARRKEAVRPGKMPITIEWLGCNTDAQWMTFGTV